MNKYSRYIGRKFGRLTILSLCASKNKHCKSQYLCECECGTRKIIVCGSITSGLTLSCGCLKRENSTSHGMHNTSEYRAWQQMKDRCLNKNNKHYNYYGGRGIKICNEWLDFNKFIVDMGLKQNKKLSLDRINNNKGYSKDNCRWATRYVQSNNTRQNRVFTINGITNTLTEFAREYKMSIGTVRGRMKRNWDIIDALTIPINKKFINKRFMKAGGCTGVELIRDKSLKIT